jgi:hypothetical protein
MASRLPEEGGLHKNFNIMIAGFMGMLSKRRQQMQKTEYNEDQFAEYCTRILTEEIMESLFKLTSRLVSARPKLLALVRDYTTKL